MLLVAPKTVRPSSAVSPLDWPAEVEFIVSALQAAQTSSGDGTDSRSLSRMAYRVRASLKLFSDSTDMAPWQLFTREVSIRGLGFLSRQWLPLSHGGWVELPAPDGQMMRVGCTVLRCHEVAPGWFEGAVYFNREQPAFNPDPD
jgi:hypothetical protein